MADEEIRHPFYRDLATIQAKQTDGSEVDHRALILGLLERHPDLDALWTCLSDLQAQMGDLPAARESLARALEIAPHAPHLHQRNARLRMEELTYPQRLAHARELCRLYPDALALKAVLAGVRMDDPDGLSYEDAWKDYLRFFPRDPAAYAALANWCLAQDREDLARGIFAEGRPLLDASELPLADFELPDHGGARASASFEAVPPKDADAETLLAQAARNL
ncbi:MAG: hypothetical protein BWK77_07645, partial [Verrucomicrobia bacterium A1]